MLILDTTNYLAMWSSIIYIFLAVPVDMLSTLAQQEQDLAA